MSRLLGLCPDKQQAKRPCWSSAIPLVGVKSESFPVVAGGGEKGETPPLLRDFQAEGESPALGLFHAAAFSTALLPTNSAKEPQKYRLNAHGEPSGRRYRYSF